MSNHFYTIDGSVRRQTDGGAIGSDETGENSRVFMLLWDNRLILKCKSLGISIDLYNRYVDDQTIVMRAIGKGWRFNAKKNKMEFSSDVELADGEVDGVQVGPGVVGD